MEGLAQRLLDQRLLEARRAPVGDSAVAVKEDLPVDLAAGESVRDHEDQDNPPVASVSDEAAQTDQTSLAPQKQMQTTFPSKALSSKHLDGNGRQQKMLDVILKNQEALQMVLRNQDLLKSLVDKVQKTVSNIDERLRVIEQEMGLLAQFTQELSEVGDEASSG